MSVEKIAPLGQTTMDLLTTLKPVSGSAADSRRAPRALLAQPPDIEGALHRYDSLTLPLPDTTQEAGGETTARVSALYREAAASGATIALSEGRLPVPALRHAVETLLTDLAATRRTTVAKLLAEAEETEPMRLPSRNGETAQFAFRGRLAASDADGKLHPLDLYLTRINGHEWEAAAYERTPARAAGLFPRPAPLVDLHRLVIDPDSGLVRVCIPWRMPRLDARDPERAPDGVAPYARLAAALTGAGALLMLFTQGPSWGPGALLVAALLIALATG